MKKILVIALVAIAAMAQAQDITPGEKLAQVARSLENSGITYDPSYTKISYPGGDVPEYKGVCADVVIRALRKAFDWDLQYCVHEYKKEQGEKTDTNIDHRRVSELVKYFDALASYWEDYQMVKSKDVKSEPLMPGDIIVMDLGYGRLHIGIMVDDKEMIHNIGRGQLIDPIRLYEQDIIRVYEIH